jgi:hypothetical protein
LILEHALSILIQDLERKKLAAIKSQHPSKTRSGARIAGSDLHAGATVLDVQDARTELRAPNQESQRSASPLKRSRYVSASVRREVWRRDEGRCAFIGTHGRCRERGFLELHHIVPFADGGDAAANNLELRCQAHNQHEAELWSTTRPRPTLWFDDG